MSGATRDAAKTGKNGPIKSAKSRARERREKFVTFRVDWENYRRLKDRTARAGARTVSAYARLAVLTGREIDMPIFETLRDLRNEIIHITAAIKTAPEDEARDRVLERASAALERIAKF
jgi:hypothetical protein